MTKAPMTQRHQDRRRRALLLLERQLESGVKPYKAKRDGPASRKGPQHLPLTDADRQRIQNQILNLKHRLDGNKGKRAATA